MPIAVILFILSIIVLSFLFGGMVIRWQMNLKREELAAHSRGSLGTGELRDMIQDVMLDTIAPLEERLDVIERQTRLLAEPAEPSAAKRLPEPPGEERP